MEPPPSVAVAIAAMPAASAAPEPPLDPPGDQSVPHGFVVVPYSVFVVNPANANSGWFVLPTTIAPAARSRRGTSPSAEARRRVRERQRPERRRHARHVLHVLHQQREARRADPGPRRAAIRSSIARASSTACSRTRITALSGGFRRSIRSRDSSTRLGRRRPAGSDRRREVRQVHRLVTMSRMRTIAPAALAGPSARRSTRFDRERPSRRRPDASRLRRGRSPRALGDAHAAEAYRPADVRA